MEISWERDFDIPFNVNIICNTVHFTFCHLFSLLFNSGANAVYNVLQRALICFHICCFHRSNYLANIHLGNYSLLALLRSLSYFFSLFHDVPHDSRHNLVNFTKVREEKNNTPIKQSKEGIAIDFGAKSV